MRIAQLAHLLVGHARQALRGVAQRGAPEAGSGVEELCAGIIPDVDALAARHDDGAFLEMPRQIGLRMDYGGDVARLH